MSANLYDLTAESLDGKPVALADYKGKVLLFVNVASKCGFTPQYAGLEELYRKYKDQGFEVLGFPCNQFGAQEPGDAAEIASFCSLTYEVSFPMFAKVEVNGAGAHPVYKHLKEDKPGILGIEAIKWNFTKFLVNKTGETVARFGPQVTPAQIGPEIEKLLAA
jgi:glutathione peroxidase